MNPTCPPCHGFCQQGRACPSQKQQIQLPDLPPEDQSEEVPGIEYVRPALIVLLAICLIAAIASCIHNHG